MTLRTKTLTAALALTVAAGGLAYAQETTTTVPLTQPDAATQEAPGQGTTFVATPAETDAAAAPAEGTAEAAAPAAEAGADAEAQAEAATEPGTEAAAGPDTADSGSQTEPEAPSTDGEGVDAVAISPGGEAVVPAETHTDVPQVEEHFQAEQGVVEAVAGHGEEPHDDDHGTDHGYGHVEDVHFSFEGPFGRFDQFQLQRGLQVYTEVCSACHGLEYVPIRTLSDPAGPGLPEDQVRAYAAELLPILDPALGEERSRLPTDNFPSMDGDGMGPDLSLMAKARAGFHGPYGLGLNQLFRGIGGPEYIHALLTGYTGEDLEQAGTLLHANTAFPGGWISMAPPLSDDRVTYEDGTPATVDQMSMDVAAFLMWTAEPNLMNRKQVGLVSVLFLVLLTVLLYLTNKRLWAPHKVKRKH